MSDVTVILDEVGASSSTPVGRYATGLACALLETAPDGIRVDGFTAAVPDDRLASIEAAIPGMRIREAALPEREMRQAWLRSVTTLPIGGIVHATSLFAPTRGVDREPAADQIVVTLHGLDALSDRSKRKGRWVERALERAHRFADGIVVPTHAIAAALAEHHDFGDRVRVIAGAPSAALTLPDDADARAERLGLPEAFILAVTTAADRAGAREIVGAIAHPAFPDAPVVVVGPVAWGETSLAEMGVAAGLPPSRLLALGELDDADLAVVYDRATTMLYPGRRAGFALPLLEAATFGVPVVHLATPTLLETAAGTSLAVDEGADALEALALGVSHALSDGQLRERLSLAAQDRARAFSWRSSARAVWQFHAEL